MNIILYVFAAAACCLAEPEPLAFDDALAKRKITATAKATQGSTHYQQPVSLELKNMTATPLSLRLPRGRYFRSSDTTDQNFVSTETLLVTLAPAEQKTLPVPAMCVNHQKSSPTPGQAYLIKKNVDGRLAKAAEYIEKNKLSGTYLGQTVMWCVSDNEPLENVFGFDEGPVDEAVKFLAGLTGKPVPAPPAADDYRRNPRAKPKVEVGGSFDFRFSSPKAVQVAMFNVQNIAVRELYNNPHEPAGSRKVDFVFDGSVYTDEKYYIRFLADNRILMEHELSF